MNLKRIAAVGILAYVLVKQYPDMRRYLKMERM